RLHVAGNIEVRATTICRSLGLELRQPGGDARQAMRSGQLAVQVIDVRDVQPRDVGIPFNGGPTMLEDARRPYDRCAQSAKSAAEDGGGQRVGENLVLGGVQPVQGFLLDLCPVIVKAMRYAPDEAAGSASG